MISAVDRYLDTLLAFVPQKKANRFPTNYLSIIHVPAEGPEKVYSLLLDAKQPVLTVASYQSAVWQTVEQLGTPSGRPELDALQATVEADHPVFDYLTIDHLRDCGNHSDGQPGMDYYLMLWQKDGEANVVECYEPYAREDRSWLTVVGALQALSSQFEYAAR
jgi:hypothetical protein